MSAGVVLPCPPVLPEWFSGAEVVAELAEFLLQVNPSAVASPAGDAWLETLRDRFGWMDLDDAVDHLMRADPNGRGAAVADVLRGAIHAKRMAVLVDDVGKDHPDVWEFEWEYAVRRIEADHRRWAADATQAVRRASAGAKTARGDRLDLLLEELAATCRVHADEAQHALQESSPTWDRDARELVGGWEPCDFDAFAQRQQDFAADFRERAQAWQLEKEASKLRLAIARSRTRPARRCSTARARVRRRRSASRRAAGTRSGTDPGGGSRPRQSGLLAGLLFVVIFGCVVTTPAAPSESSQPQPSTETRTHARSVPVTSATIFPFTVGRSIGRFAGRWAARYAACSSSLPARRLRGIIERAGALPDRDHGVFLAAAIQDLPAYSTITIGFPRLVGIAVCDLRGNARMKSRLVRGRLSIWKQRQARERIRDALATGGIHIDDDEFDRLFTKAIVEMVAFPDYGRIGEDATRVQATRRSDGAPYVVVTPASSDDRTRQVVCISAEGLRECGALDRPGEVARTRALLRDHFAGFGPDYLQREYAALSAFERATRERSHPGASVQSQGASRSRGAGRPAGARRRATRTATRSGDSGDSSGESAGEPPSQGRDSSAPPLPEGER